MSHYPNGSVLQIPASTNQGSSTLCLKDLKFEYLIGNCCQKERSQTLTILDKEKSCQGFMQLSHTSELLAATHRCVKD
jgi:hypothetical protein